MKDWSPIGFKTSKERKIKRDTEGKIQTKSPYEKEVEMKPPTRCGVGFDRGPESDFPRTHTNSTELSGISPLLHTGKGKQNQAHFFYCSIVHCQQTQKGLLHSWFTFIFYA